MMLPVLSVGQSVELDVSINSAGQVETSCGTPSKMREATSTYLQPESPTLEQAMKMSLVELEHKTQMAEARVAELNLHTSTTRSASAHDRPLSRSSSRCSDDKVYGSGSDRESTAAIAVTEQLSDPSDTCINRLSIQVHSALQYVDGISGHLDDLDQELNVQQQECERLDREKQIIEACKRAAEKTAADSDVVCEVLQSRMAEMKHLWQLDRVALQSATQMVAEMESRLRAAVDSDNKTAKKVVLIKTKLAAEQAAHVQTKATADKANAAGVDELTALMQLASNAAELHLAVKAEAAAAKAEAAAAVRASESAEAAYRASTAELRAAHIAEINSIKDEATTEQRRLESKVKSLKYQLESEQAAAKASAATAIEELTAEIESHAKTKARHESDFTAWRSREAELHADNESRADELKTWQATCKDLQESAAERQAMLLSEIDALTSMLRKITQNLCGKQTSSRKQLNHREPSHSYEFSLSDGEGRTGQARWLTRNSNA